MLEKEIFTLVLGTGLVSAFVTALFTKVIADKNHKIENITKERKEWRDRLRLIVVDVVKAYQNEDINALRLLEAELVVRLNPDDCDDLLILKTINEISSEWSESKVQEFCDRVSYLLKHDWERVKQESTTKISSQSLTFASIVATIILATFFAVFDIQLPVLPSGIFLSIVLSMPALVDYFIIKGCLSNNKIRKPKDFINYICNRIKRKKYKVRSVRK